MAFTNIGAANALVAAASISPRGAYVGTEWVPGQGVAASQPQRLLQQQRASFHHMMITGATLAGRVDNAVAPAGADVGVLDTAATAANIHGLPTNFGPGRGLWTVDDEARLLVNVYEEALATADFNGAGAAITAGGIFPRTDMLDVIFAAGANPAFGNYQFLFKARSRGIDGGAGAGGGSVLRIQIIYLHSDNL
jgi:hypothetical protein